MKTSILFVVMLIFSTGVCQQVSDTLSVPQPKSPAYKPGTGPVIVIDEAHHNFHTAVGRFRPFAILLERDGYKVSRGTSPFTKTTLDGAGILVISNALSERNETEWSVPTPSAFTDDEIAVVKKWVEDGGSLFLISDHHPFPGCNEKLAAAFGFRFYNGFAFDTTKQGGPDSFTIANKKLIADPLTSGLDPILSFTGQAFDIPAAAKPLLVLDEKFKLWIGDTAWVFNKSTKRISARGKAQGAYMTHGKGRLVVFGEAAMFTAQLAGRNKMGFNVPMAEHNAEFLLRLIHWLDKP